MEKRDEHRNLRDENSEMGMRRRMCNVYACNTCKAGRQVDGELGAGEFASKGSVSVAPEPECIKCRCSRSSAEGSLAGVSKRCSFVKSNVFGPTLFNE